MLFINDILIDCPVCLAAFSSEVARERHIKAAHQFEYYHKCKVNVFDYFKHVNSKEHRNQRKYSIFNECYIGVFFFKYNLNDVNKDDDIINNNNNNNNNSNNNNNNNSNNNTDLNSNSNNLNNFNISNIEIEPNDLISNINNFSNSTNKSRLAKEICEHTVSLESIHAQVLDAVANAKFKTYV